MKKGSKKKSTKKKTRAEYNFKECVRGTYAGRYAKGSNIVILSSDVAKVFPDSESANQALRAIVEMMKQIPGSPVSSEK